MANPKNNKDEKTDKKTESGNSKNNELLIENAASYISRGSRATEEEQQRKFQKHELNNLEAILAYDFAIENKLWFADINVFGNPFPGGGNENELYYNEETGTIFKVNNLFNNELSISSFLKYIQYHNTLFETNAYTLIGFTGFSNNVHHIKGAIPYVAPIVAQKYVPNSENATIPEVHKHMELLGFEKVNDHTYKNKEYIVSDLWERNVLKDKEGNIHIVDNMIKKINTKKMSRGGKLVGASHAEGGIDIITPNGKIEAEGGEIIITKKASEEHCETLSKINQSGGGIAIPCDNNSKQPKKAANGAIIAELSGEHKEAMIMANKLLTSGTVEENAETVVKEWRSHLLPHFKEEESQIYKVRMDADSKHFIAEHKKIKQLVEKIAADPKEKDINQFAEMLIHHINEEEIYFNEIDNKNIMENTEILDGSIVTVKGKEGDYSVISHSGDDYTIKRVGFMKYDDYKGSFNAKLSDLTIVQKAKEGMVVSDDVAKLSWNAHEFLKRLQRLYPDNFEYDTTKKSDNKLAAKELLEAGIIKNGLYKDGFQEVKLTEKFIPFDKKYKLQPWLKAGEYYDVERLDLKGNPEGRKDKHALLKYVDHTGLGPNGNEWGLYFTTEHSSFFIPYSKLDHYLLNNWIVQSTPPPAMEKPKETPKKEVVKEKTADDIVQELSEGKIQTPINSSVVNNWDKVPAAWRNTREIKEIKYINSPYDKGLLSIVKPFFGTDPLNPKFSGVNFDDAGITVTDGAKLIHLPYPNAKYKANYATGPAIKSTIDPPKNDIFTGSAYPNYPAVIPHSGKEENHVYEFDTYKVLQYSKAALKYANKAAKQSAFKYGEQIIGFNNEFLIEIMEAALKLGHKKLYATFRKPNNAVVFSPDKNYEVGKSEILLVMPVILWADKGETPELGASDLDFARQLNAYFDFTDNEIHNADGSVAKFQMNYGDDSVLDANTLMLLEKFRKSISNSALSHILEHFIVKGDKIFASTIETEVLVKNTNSLLTDGAYDIINGAVEFNAFFPAEDYPKQTEPDNQDYKFIISASILKYYLDKAFDYLGNDDLRPQMNGYSIQYVGGKMLIYATNAHILFKADITRYAEVNKNQVDFAVILSKENVLEFLDYVGEDAIVFKANKLFTTIECSTGKFTSKNIDAKYPNAEGILPKGNNKSLTINIKDLYNCLKGEEAVKFVKENRKGNTINIYDKKSSDTSVLDIYLGYSAQEGGVWKLQKEVKICSVPFKYSESEKPLINTGSLLIIMPVMRDGESSAEGYFAFGEKFFHQILDTCSSEEITLEFLAPNRAYVIPGEDFDFNKTVSAKKEPKPLPLTPKQEWQNAINTLKQDGGPDSVEAIETLEMLLKEKYEAGGMIGKDEYEQLLREYDRTGAFLEDTEDSGDMEERSRLKAKLNEIESKIHRYERSYEEGGSIKFEPIQTPIY